MSPRFIAIEGLDGSGGTTQVALLVTLLKARGQAAHPTSEPSTGPAGQFLRRVLNPEDPASVLGDSVLPFLFAADRRDHLDREIIPKLQGGSWVLSDRYYHSSLAYQSLSVGLAHVAQLNQGFRAPDLTIFLDLPPEVCLARIDARGGVRERFEALDRLRHISDAYDAVLVHCRSRGERIARVDATGTVDQVHQRIVAAIDALD